MTTSTTTWRTDTPPAAGWYAASTERCEQTRRHWSGNAWSAPCWADDTPRHFDRARRTAADALARVSSPVPNSSRQRDA